MDTVTLLKKDLEIHASRAPEYIRDTRNAEMITQLANKLCVAMDAQDSDSINIYSSALLLKFWDYVFKIYNKTKTAGKTYEDAIDILWSCIHTACEKKYRAWQTNPALNAQQCISQTIATRGIAAVMYESNLKKNEGFINVTSLDAELDSESGLTLGDTIEDESAAVDNGTARDIIQACIQDNHIVEAIIMDTMATKDVFKHESHIKKQIDAETGEEYRYTQSSSTFWPYKLVQELNDLGEEYVKYFLSTYDIPADKFKLAFESLSKANNQKKYKFISRTQEYGRALLAL